jgi:hypothetical protein
MPNNKSADCRGIDFAHRDNSGNIDVSIQETNTSDAIQHIQFHSAGSLAGIHNLLCGVVLSGGGVVQLFHYIDFFDNFNNFKHTRYPKHS